MNGPKDVSFGEGSDICRELRIRSDVDSRGEVIEDTVLAKIMFLSAQALRSFQYCAMCWEKGSTRRRILGNCRMAALEASTAKPSREPSAFGRLVRITKSLFASRDNASGRSTAVIPPEPSIKRNQTNLPDRIRPVSVMPRTGTKAKARRTRSPGCSNRGRRHILLPIDGDRPVA